MLQPGMFHFCKRLLLFAFFLIPVITSASGAGEPEFGELKATDWPHWRGIGWDSKSSETFWVPDNLKKENIIWEINAGRGYSSMAVVDGQVYTSGIRHNSEVVSCIDSRNGKLIWENSLKQKFPAFMPAQSTPTVEDSGIYIMTTAGAVFCLDRKTGKTIWSYDLADKQNVRIPRWGFSSSVKIYKDLAVVNAGTGGVALNKFTGRLIWANPEGEAGYTTPVIFSYDEKDLLAVSTNEQLLIVRPDDGSIICTYPWEGSLQDYPADPLIIQNEGKTEILISHAYQEGAALFEFDGRSLVPVWEDHELVSNINSLVCFDGYIWANSNPAYSARDLNSEFFCMNVAEGRKIWTQPARLGTVISVGEYIIRLDQLGSVFIGKRSLEGFDESSSLKILKATAIALPVFSDGKLFCRNDGGDIVCIDLSL